jgi:hypothetical protein
VTDQTSIRNVAQWLTTTWGLALLFALGLSLRLLLAPHTGNYDDLGRHFRPWAVRLADVGPRHFYDGYIADPPGYLLFLWPLGRISQALGQSQPSTLLLKMPSILADLGLAWVASEFAMRITPPSVARAKVVRTVVVAAVLFNPAVFWVSSVWGEADTLGTFLLLASLMVLFTWRGRYIRELAGMALLGLAVAVEPQVGLAFPAVAFALVWWHVRGGRPPRERGVELLKAVGCGLTFFLALGAIGIPFGLGILETLHRYGGSTSINDFSGLWSYNLWGVLGPWQHDLQGDSILYVAGVPALYFGLLLFAIGISLVMWRAWRALQAGLPEATVLLFTAAASSAMAFALLTRMWERYLLMPIVCLAPLLFFRRLWRVYGVLLFALLVSEYYHYVFGAQLARAPTFRIEFIYVTLLGGDAVDAWQRKLISGAILLLLLWLAIWGWRSLRPRGIDESPDEGEPAYAIA